MPDPISEVALSLVSSPGAYVLLIGSGVSRPAGIPTGWEVIESLIGRLAAADGQTRPTDPSSWYEQRTGHKPTYGELIESLAPLPAERSALLTSFFEPNQGERERGLKQPTAAHRAIAELVDLGVVRVVVTTNFDRLLEMALAERGINASVVSTDDDLGGLPPLTQVRCVVVKVHGDYLDTRIRNTADEVAQLDPDLSTWLQTLFSQYGVVVAGWSGDYDAGLRGVIDAAAQPQYGAYWTHRSELTPLADQLAQHRNARRIKITDADSFFTRLLESVKSVRDLLEHGPLDEEIAVATAKRHLAAPGGRDRPQ